MLSAEVKQPQKCGLHVCENPVGFRTNGCNVCSGGHVELDEKVHAALHKQCAVNQSINQSSLTDIVKQF